LGVFQREETMEGRTEGVPAPGGEIASAYFLNFFLLRGKRGEEEIRYLCVAEEITHFYE